MIDPGHRCISRCPPFFVSSTPALSLTLLVARHINFQFSSYFCPSSYHICQALKQRSFEAYLTFYLSLNFC